MSKVSDLINEKWIIKNKEHLSKEDYERLADIETELKEISKIIDEAFSSNNKMTNKEKINNMTSKEFADTYAKYVCNSQYCEVGYEDACPCYELCDIIFDVTSGDKFPGCAEIFRQWLESEVEE